MFSLGFPELIIIALLALFVLDSKDLPKIMYSLGKFFKRLSYIRYAFTKQFEDFMNEQEFKEMQDKAANRDSEPVENDTETEVTAQAKDTAQSAQEGKK